MISAKEAREIVELGQNEKAVEQMEQIEWEINNAINNGHYNIGINGYIEKANRTKLESLGYRIETGSQYNESYFTISW